MPNDLKEAQVVNHEDILRRLTEANEDPSAGLNELCHAYLKIGEELLGMKLGIISQVEGNRYHVYAVSENDNGIEDGTDFILGETLCREVYKKNDLFFIGNIGQSQGLREHPAVKAFSLQSFVGLPIYVSQRFFGTLNFSCFKEKKDLSALEVFVLKSMASHLGQRLTQEIDESMYRMILRNAAHELRAPLNGIIGSEEILRESELDHDQFEMLDLINRSSAGLEEAISEISHATKLLYDPRSGLCEKPNEIIDQTLDDFHQSFKKADFFIKRPPQTEHQFKCSPDVFKNALKLIIKDCLTRVDKRNELVFDFKEDEHQLILEINNSGPCLSRNVVEVINSFGTLEGLNKNIKVSGVNLDLTLAAISMHLAGGFLKVMVAPDNTSTTFNLGFPIS